MLKLDTLYNQDCMAGMSQIEEGSIDLAFADPPFNIGYKYDVYEDRKKAQDYLDWGAQGPGRWVTVYATRSPTPHVFMVIAGLRLDTSHRGTDTGPNRDEDGPRWRVLDGIPTWARWSVRHPPGL